MAVESKHIPFFLPNLFAVNEDKKPKPDYYIPSFTNQILPRLSSTNIPIPKLISRNPDYSIKFEDPSPKPSPNCMEEESAVKVVRSVVSGFILRRFQERKMFTPINSQSIVYFLKKERLLAPFEKRALLELGQDDENEDEILISAVNSALLSIEADTDAVKCLFLNNLNGIYRDRVDVLAILPDKLVHELLPVPFRLEDLALDHLFPNHEELEAIRLERLRVLSEKDY